MIVGHQKQWEELYRLAERDAVPHALMFYGPAQVGKRTVARAFARHLTGAEGAWHPDIIEVAPDDKNTIAIETVREISRNMALTPTEAPYRVCIIDRAHRMPYPAQNAVLKTLEEPASYRVFILVTEFPARLLPTIHSRVRKERFGAVDTDSIREKLCNEEVEANIADRAVAIAGGAPGAALEMARNEELLTSREQQRNGLDKLMNAPLYQRFATAKELSDKSAGEIQDILNLWVQYLRRQLYEHTDDTQQLSRITNRIEGIEKVRQLLRDTNVNTKLALETLFLQL